MLPIRINRQLGPSLVVGLALVVVVVTACGSSDGTVNTDVFPVEVEVSPPRRRLVLRRVADRGNWLFPSVRTTPRALRASF